MSSTPNSPGSNNGYFAEVTVIQDSKIITGEGAEDNVRSTRVRVQRVTQMGDFTYELSFPEGMIIAREDMDGTGELIHPEDYDAVKGEIARATQRVHHDRSSDAREDLRRSIFRLINTTPRPKSVGVVKGGTKQYRTSGTKVFG